MRASAYSSMQTTAAWISATGGRASNSCGTAIVSATTCPNRNLGHYENVAPDICARAYPRLQTSERPTGRIVVRSRRTHDSATSTHLTHAEVATIRRGYRPARSREMGYGRDQSAHLCLVRVTSATARRIPGRFPSLYDVVSEAPSTFATAAPPAVRARSNAAPRMVCASSSMRCRCSGPR